MKAGRSKLSQLYGKQNEVSKMEDCIRKMVLKVN